MADNLVGCLAECCLLGDWVGEGAVGWGYLITRCRISSLFCENVCLFAFFSAMFCFVTLRSLTLDLVLFFLFALFVLAFWLFAFFFAFLLRIRQGFTLIHLNIGTGKTLGVVGLMPL